MTMNLNAEWKGLSLTAQFNASWGGYSFLPDDAISLGNQGTSANKYNDLGYANMPSFWTTDNMFVYNDVVDAEVM